MSTEEEVGALSSVDVFIHKRVSTSVGSKHSYCRTLVRQPMLGGKSIHSHVEEIQFLEEIMLSEGAPTPMCRTFHQM